jgi:hypothetical protein
MSLSPACVSFASSARWSQVVARSSCSIEEETSAAIMLRLALGGSEEGSSTRKGLPPKENAANRHHRPALIPAQPYATKGRAGGRELADGVAADHPDARSLRKDLTRRPVIRPLGLSHASARAPRRCAPAIGLGVGRAWVMLSLRGAVGRATLACQ